MCHFSLNTTCEKITVGQTSCIIFRVGHERATALCIGVDGGATNSFGIVVDLSGNCPRLAQAGSLNFIGTQLAEARTKSESSGESTGGAPACR